MTTEKPERLHGSEPRMLRYVVLAVLPFATIVPLVQLWGHYHWLINDSDRCDFPQECFDVFYPDATSKLELLWSVGVALGLALVICSALLRDKPEHTWRIGAAASASFLSICLTPIHPGWQLDSLSNSGPFALRASYAAALGLLLLAAMLYGWELVARTVRRPRQDLPETELCDLSARRT